MLTLRNIIVTILLFLAYYTIHMYSIKTFISYFNLSNSPALKIYPIFLLIILSYVTKNTYLISKTIYPYIIYISTGYLAFMVNVFLCSFSYKLINFFIKIPEILNEMILLLFPVIISAYGLINARMIFIENITVKRTNINKKNTSTIIKNISNSIKGIIKPITKSSPNSDPNTLQINQSPQNTNPNTATLNIYNQSNSNSDSDSTANNSPSTFINSYQTPIKIAHLTDIHLGSIFQTSHSQKIVSIIKKINPNLVVITGDLFDSNSIPKYEWLSPFESLDIPILYVTGNHENLIGKKEILTLVSKSKFIHIGSSINGYQYGKFNFYGVDYEFDFLKRIKEFKFNKRHCNIILNHVPSYKPRELKGFDIFMVLCGHTHGGQIFPLHIMNYLFNKCFRGLYCEDGKYVYVCNGCGTSVFPMRIFARAKIGVINIE